ncbi:MAG: hypothetical protein KAT16_02605 [Candidatus Heimdallarchaeota archaeon]|nr:hypothetical protein [Candidatus Heimdallarchaeota archaeon]
MIINAEVFQLEEDPDNNLYRADFRDEKQSLRGKIEIPSEVLNFEDTKKFQIEIIPNDNKDRTFKDELIVFNAVNMRTKPLGKEHVYSFSSGGFMVRIFTTKLLKEFKSVLKEFLIIVR